MRSSSGRTRPAAGPSPHCGRVWPAYARRGSAVLAADLPFLRSGHVGELRRGASGRSGAVLVDPDGRPQWLAGVWRTADLLDALADYSGASLRGLMQPLEPACVRPPAGERPWHDCDTPSDVESAARLIEENRA